MARTRQTARKSTGGMAPRSYMNSSSSSNIREQLSTYNETKTRTIEVIGEAEFDVAPDEVKLTFKIKEKAYKVEDALQAAIEKLSEVREALSGLGVTNENISTDSVNVLKDYEYVRTNEDGLELEIIEKSEVEADSDDDERPWLPFGSRSSNRGRDDKAKEAEKKEKKKLFKKLSFFFASTIIRVHLNKDTIDKFSETMFLLMSMGLQNHKAPIYDLSDFTEQRAFVRTEATKNAYVKAKAMVDVLSDTVELGPPILLKDVPLEVDDDADDCFEGSYNRWGFFRSEHTRVRAANEDDPNEEPSQKRARTATNNEKEDKEGDETQSKDQFDFQEHLKDLFVVPPIRIMACVPIVFELIPKGIDP